MAMDFKQTLTQDADSNMERQTSEWAPELEELQRRREMAAAMGGPEAVAKQHASGRLTVRERIAALFDAGSFREVGTLVGSGKYDEHGKLLHVTPSSIVMGKGKIDGRTTVMVADDFTIRGGSSESSVSEKWLFGDQLAIDLQVPLIRLVDMAGGSVRLVEKIGATKPPGYRYATGGMPDPLPVVPTVAVALGPCAGLGAFRIVQSHFSVMVKETSQIFSAGPHVVTPGTGEQLTKEELGGYRVHARGSGVVDNEAESEPDAFAQVKRFLSYLPSNVFTVPPRITPADSPERVENALASAIPRNRRRVYNMRRVLEMVFDSGSLFEIGRYQGASVITMLGRLNGYPVGVMANDPYVAGGSLTVAASEKIMRFVDMCDTFHLPIVNFFDQPGVAIGKAAEEAGTIRKAVRAITAINQVSVPWATIIVRRAFGVAGVGYGPYNKANVRYAWPSAHWGSIPIEGGVEAAYRREIAAAPDPKKRRDELVEYYRRYESPFRTAEKFLIDEIIDPRETRPLLCEWAEEAYALVPRLLGITRRTIRP